MNQQMTPIQASHAGRLKEYLEDNRATFEKAFLEDRFRVAIDYRDLELKDPALAEYLVEEPMAARPAIETALKCFNDPAINAEDLTIALTNLPNIYTHTPRTIRSRHVNKYIAIRGVVKKATGVKDTLHVGVFKCKVCDFDNHVIQETEYVTKPYECGNCTQSGNIFAYVDHESTKKDRQNVLLSDAPDDMNPGDQPEDITCLLEEDLAKAVMGGELCLMYGVIKNTFKKIHNRDGVVMTRTFMVEYVEALEGTHSTITWTKGEEEDFKALAESGEAVQTLVDNFAPHIYGMKDVKEAVILSIIGGVPTIDSKGNRTRGSIHIALWGDPSTGKSEIIESIPHYTPRCVVASGEGTSAVGLTATAVKDDFGDGQWSLEVGALGLANGGTFVLDEADKMAKKDMGAMHRAMEQQRVEVHKASIHANISTECNCIFAANPTHGRFDQNEGLLDQIDLPPAMFTRFDLMFILLDNPRREEIEATIDHILNEDKEPSMTLSPDWIKKYIAYAKSIEPVLTDAAKDALKEKFKELKFNPNLVNVSYRQLHALRRIAEAHARANLKDKVTDIDVARAMELFDRFVKAIGADGSSGRFDLGEINNGVKYSQFERIQVTKEVIRGLCEDSDSNSAHEDDVIRELLVKGLSVEESKKTIRTLKRNGEIMESGGVDHYQLV